MLRDSQRRSFRSLFFLAFAAVLLASAVGCGTGMGTKESISANESVYYSGTATAAEAQAVGKLLQEIGFFDGTAAKDVLLKKGDDGTVISFVVQDGVWNDEQYTRIFGRHGQRLATVVGGPPLTVDLIDTQLASHKSIPVDRAARDHVHSPQETVSYLDPVTLDQAKALAQALETNGYFDKNGEALVLLEQRDGKHVVSFVVQDGAWDDARKVGSFKIIGREIGAALGAQPFTLDLIDSTLLSRASLPIDKIDRIFQHTDKEKIRYQSPVTEEQAKALGVKLQEIGFFTNENGKDVCLTKDGDMTTFGFVVQEGIWDDAAMVTAFEGIGKQLAPLAENKPCKVELLDSLLEVRKTVEISQ